MKDYLAMKDFLAKNWDKPDMLKKLIGQPGCSATYHFGSIPTDRVQVDAVDGIIVRVKSWSGLNWSARWGWGSPLVDVQ